MFHSQDWEWEEVTPNNSCLLGGNNIKGNSAQLELELGLREYDHIFRDKISTYCRKDGKLRIKKQIF
jgi:hypothetical protein